jgi:hypothetical protein
VLLTNMKAKVYINLGIADTSTEVAIPRFELTDFDSNGSTNEVVAKLTEAIIRASLEAVARSDSEGLPVDLAGDLKKQLADYGSVLEEGKQAVKDLKDLFND